MNNKHNKSQVSDNHSNDDNNQPTKQRENKVWTNYMLVNFSPHPAGVEKWAGSGWAANNDKLSIPAIILTIIIALVYFIQWWKWTPWAEYKAVPLKVGRGTGVVAVPPCRVISQHVRSLFHQGPVLFRRCSGWHSVICRWSQASCHPR